MVLRRERVDHDHFHAPSALPIIGALASVYLVGPWTGRAAEQYWVALVLTGIGIVLWAVTSVINRALYGRRTSIAHPEELEHSEP